ncbi:MAG: sugar kinase [Thermoplasmata archaeon]|jgi:NAD+ kinase|nr:MAG: sugar kinase [Thermoplasmata archaeon]RLF64593.1 MAG: sugar kinase [Thermoplasmata archaeon]
MKWGIVSKPDTGSLSIAKGIYELLGDAMLEKKIASYLSLPGHSIKEIGKKADKIVVVGGDGTILMVLRYTSKPLFTVNTGSVGFLAEVEPSYAVEGMKKVLDGEYFIDERARVKTVLNGERLPDATNEVTFHVSNVGKMLSIELVVDGVPTEYIDGDGILISTPTGSTSYSLSVGGPIVDPSIRAFVIAPIAPFRHISSPLIVPDDKKLNVRIRGEKNAKIIIDGIRAGVLSKGDDITLSLSEKKSSFIRLEEDFYRRVYDMLSFRVKRTKNGENKGD